MGEEKERSPFYQKRRDIGSEEVLINLGGRYEGCGSMRDPFFASVEWLFIRKIKGDLPPWLCMHIIRLTDFYARALEVPLENPDPLAALLAARERAVSITAFGEVTLRTREWGKPKQDPEQMKHLIWSLVIHAEHIDRFFSVCSAIYENRQALEILRSKKQGKLVIDWKGKSIAVKAELPESCPDDDALSSVFAGQAESELDSIPSAWTIPFFRPPLQVPDKKRPA